jgi:hypothetical protein
MHAEGIRNFEPFKMLELKEGEENLLEKKEKIPSFDVNLCVR